MTDAAPDLRRKENDEFAELVAASGRTQAETAAYLSRRVGRPVTNYAVSRWVSDRVKVPVDIMDAARELAAQPATAAAAAQQYEETSDVVPLFGYANAAGSTLRIAEDQRVGVVPIHPGQRGSRSAFAFIVFGDSLVPRLNNGETGYAVRNRTPFKGQPCIVELTNGEAFVKLYEGQDDSTLFASQLNPKKALTWPLREVSAVHAVVGASFGPA